MMAYVKCTGISHSKYLHTHHSCTQIYATIFSVDLFSGIKTLQTKLKLLMYPIPFLFLSNLTLKCNQYTELDIDHSHLCFILIFLQYPNGFSLNTESSSVFS